MRKFLTGSLHYPLGQQIKDTIEAHGYYFAYEHYVRKHRMAVWEFQILSGISSDLC